LRLVASGVDGHAVGLLRRLLVSLALASAVASFAAVAAQAEIVTSHDAAGRTINFDVRVAGADVEWYAGLLRSAPHGNEISTVTIRIVPRSDIVGYCGGGAAACYGSNVIYAALGHDTETAHELVHEYGHHLDSAWPVAGVRELNGTPVWWQLRGIAAMLAQGTLAFDYSKGWSHSIGEIFAEDYAYMVVGDNYDRISWLGPPSAALKAALFAEIGGTPTTTAPPATQPAARATSVIRRGVIRPGRRSGLPFRLLGPGRHVTFSATVGGSNLRGTRAQLELVCDGRVVGREIVVQGQRSASLDLGGLGPATCEADLFSTSTRPLAYLAQLRLALDVQ
jgi:hypothetical protein